MKRSATGDLAESDAEKVLRVDRVSARYPGAVGEPAALEQVSLEMSPGDIVALLGANGSGKSTLLRVAGGLLEPVAGDVWIAGRNARRVDRGWLARVVTLLPQSEPVATGFRVREVVAMGRAPHQDVWLRERPADREMVDRALAACDLLEKANRRVDELSGGEQRRVGFARAIAQRPRVLLLDEPTAFLDLRHRLELYDLLQEIVTREGIACLVALHELEAAMRLASQVVLLREGRVVASGPPGVVLTSQLLRDTFDVEVIVHRAGGQTYFHASRPRAG